jgi:hypothetical protein
MTSWTERYLEVVLRSIPEPKRADVDRELRSSIADAVEERVAAGEERATAERAVLEGLGDPAQLAAAYSGRPNYLIGPELFPIYRRFVPRLLAVVVPIAAVVLAAVEVLGGGSYADAVTAAISGAITVAIQIAFWTTLTFVFLERADTAREARTELVEAGGRWTVDQLPEPETNRVTASDAVGEVITTIITVGGLVFLAGLTASGTGGATVSLFDPALTGFWFPVLIALLAAVAVLQVVVYAVGRWTIPLAVVYTALEIAFAAPVVWLALNGTLVNPAFAEAVGYPPLAEGDAPVMLALAVVTTLVTGWEIVSAFRGALRSRRSGHVPHLARSSR